MSNTTQVQEQIYGLVKSESWPLLVTLCEDFELDVSNSKTAPFYAVQLFAYLLVDNLNSARLLWRRIPAHVKSNTPSIEAVWNLAKQLQIGDIAAFFAASTSQEWDSTLATLNTKLLSVYRQRTITLMAKSYDNITLKSMASQLGLPEADTERYATRLGWTYDAATSYLQPAAALKQDIQSIPLSNLATLTSYVVHLEQQ